MRGKTILSVMVSLVVFSACGEKDKKKDGKDDMTIVVEADRSNIEEQEKDLRVQQEDIARKQKDLEKERDDLIAAQDEVKDKAQIKRLLGQLRDVVEREKKMRAREAALDKKLDELSRSKSNLLDRVAASGGGLDPKAAPTARVAARERAMAGREKGVAAREAEYARREKDLAQREADLARREAALMRNQASLASARIPVPRAVSRGSQPVSPAKVAKKYKAVLKKMRRRGILRADLPLESASLLKEIEAAKKEGDSGKMMDLVEQLDAVLASTKVNAAFIEGKFNRMDRLHKQRQPKGADKQKVSSLLRKATQLYADGKYGMANSELNKINALLTR